MRTLLTKKLNVLLILFLLTSTTSLFSQAPFVDVTIAAGLVSPTNPLEPLSHVATEYFNTMNFGSGAAWIDYDDDDDLDLYITNREAPNYMFKNNGDGTFTDEGFFIGVADTLGDGSGASFADYDNDGWKDLYLCNGLGDKLLRNNEGTFENVTVTAGFDPNSEKRTTSASWADYDNDGYIDLYLTRHVSLIIGDDTSQDQLYHNNGDGTFTDVSDLFEEIDLMGAGFIGGWTDFDKDGDMDLILINDCPLGNNPEQIHIFRNDGGTDGETDWTFTEVAIELGVDECKNGMGIGIGDYNRDGWMDFYYSNIGPATFHKNNGDNTFSDITDDLGVGNQDDGRYSWASLFLDFDNDGWQDLFLVGGSLYNEDFGIYDTPNFFYKNEGDESFTDISETVEMDDVSRGRNAISGDYDDDGDLDVFILNYAEPMALRQNTTDNGYHWIQIELEGTDSNRDGIGSKIKLTTPDGVVQYYETRSGSGLGGGDALYAHFGLKENTSVTEVEITWPSGTVQTETDLAVDDMIELIEPETPPLPIELSAFSAAQQGKKALISWSTFSEENNAYFLVQKSANGRDFQTIGKIDGAGNSSQFNSYDMIDPNPFKGDNYYRLKQVDVNGASVFSAVEFLNFKSNELMINIQPNPVTGNSFDVIIENGFNSTVLFSDLFGKIIWSQNKVPQNITIPTSDLSNGVYFLSVSNGKGTESFKSGG